MPSIWWGEFFFYHLLILVLSRLSLIIWLCACGERHGRACMHVFDTSREDILYLKIPSGIKSELFQSIPDLNQHSI